jgi:hypothetical protein
MPSANCTIIKRDEDRPAYAAGRAAYEAGVPANGSPHERGSLDSMAWTYGWFDAWEARNARCLAHARRAADQFVSLLNGPSRDFLGDGD